MKTILSYSGGLDSTCLLAKLLHEGEIIPVNFSYGSRHNEKERAAAEAICSHYSIPLLKIDLDFSSFKSSLLLNQDPIPEGHYEAENMRSTVVPFRNGIMLSYLAGLAESLDCQRIAIAAHSGDHHIYPDCRPEFISYMGDAIRIGTYKNILLSAPFKNLTKAEVAAVGYVLKAPLELSWTCYKGEEVHCGKCGACTERKEAFLLNSIPDPTIYKEV